MRIAFYTNTYLPNINGVSRSVSLFRKSLIELGHDVAVIAPGAADYPEDGENIFRYPAFDIKSLNYSITIPFSRTVDQHVAGFCPDVIHSHHPVLLGDIAASRAESMELPLVFTFHTRYTEYSHYAPVNQAIAKRVILNRLAHYMRNCHHIIAPSKSIRRMLVEEGISSQVTTIPTGISLEPYQRADGAYLRQELGLDDKLVLVSIGRLAKEKNWLLLVEACAQVMADYPQARLLVIGDGPQRSELESRTEQLGIADKVIFAGRIPFDQAPAYLKAGDIFCYGSTTETQGLVTLEALAAGLPVVAVDATGTRDIIKNQINGLLTENNCHALAAGIRELIVNLTLKKQLIENGAQTLDRYDINNQARRLIEVYQQAIKDKEAGRMVQVEGLSRT